MKNIVLLVTFVGSIVLLIAGKMHWDEKIEYAGMTVNMKSEKAEIKEEINRPINNEEIKKQLKNFSAAIGEKMISSTEPLSIIIVGSESFQHNTDELDLVVKNGLDNNYWKNAFTVDQMVFKEETTASLVKDQLYEQVIKRKPDIVIMESFTLNDNGLVVIDESHRNLSIIKSEIEKSLSDVSYILIPSNPIFEPGYYSIQINSLNTFAEKNNINYINHWETWPSVKEESIKNYLDGSRPNSDGINVIGEAIVNYMIGK